MVEVEKKSSVYIKKSISNPVKQNDENDNDS